MRKIFDRLKRPRKTEPLSYQAVDELTQKIKQKNRKMVFVPDLEKTQKPKKQAKLIHDITPRKSENVGL